MHLNNNNLSGAIPAALSTMPKLFHLLLDNNNFSGAIPPEIGNLPQLRILRLDNNKLEGPVPETISRMALLLELHLTNNPLNGSLPDLSAVQNLQLIRSGYVNFSPSEIPLWLLNMAKLKTLEFFKGNLVGQIPEELFSLPNLEAAFLDENRLNGSIDFSTASRSLELVSLEDNEISSVTSVPSPLTIRLSGNPVCSNNNPDKFCSSNGRIWNPSVNRCNIMCDDQKTLQPATCSCAYPLICTIQFITPPFSAITVDRIDNVTGQLSLALNISRGQIWIGSADFTSNHRLVMNILFFPPGKNVYLDQSLVSKIILLLSIQRVSVPEFGPMLLTNANQPQTTPPVAAKQTKFMFIVTLCVCVGVSAAIAGLCIVLLVVRRKRTRSPSHDYGFSSIGEIAPKFKGCKWFTLDDLKKASDNFSSNHLIGVGGYGKVYKGQLHTGELVAIKRAEKESLQGLEEFRTEIELFSRLHHKNLVNLIGFCTDDGQQMLVYEFMPNRTLRDHLYASNTAEQALNWKTRLSIALGSAKGLEYLHELADPPIIHRDVKSSNILLDENLVAKVADLGLSKLAPTCSDEKTYSSVQVKGTLGYLDPEYYAYHQLSAKSDVYSFGVVLIEIITGKQPIDNGSFIVKEIKESVAWGGVASLLSFVDKRLLDKTTVEQVKKYFRLALQCVEDSGQDRPKMNEVVKKLEEIIKLQEVHGSSDHQQNHQQNGDSNEKETTGESSFDVGALNPELYAWSSDDAEDPTFQAFGFTAAGERQAGLDHRCTVDD
ncbi:probable leucine-rich repeat receptor-like protein kinase At5g49770 isoform X1 [Selaginella moellendorffii]|nr:probable leucine-rich repeat receptor-like protein kinase At5g49770 isoform X1 [Selaginella moellendorffii]|eukprot:XP_002965380.2 probable leucine-rich repeat receptor-like protein kinase At5g49770 isoform X1 [Selaginella moellendorffii]